MFTLTYLRGELHHRTRHTLLAAAGLALGVGVLVATVATSAAVSRAQNTVLHTLNGIGADITVTPRAPAGAGARGAANSTGVSVAGNAVLDASTVDAIARLSHVAGVADSLVLTEISPPAAGSGGIPTSTRIDGIDTSRLGRGPYASATLRAGRHLRPVDTHAHVAVVDTGYAAAHHLRIGTTIRVAGTRFTVIGIVDQSAAATAGIYIPLTAAQQLASSHGTDTLTGKINAIYISATSAADIAAVLAELTALLPSATLTSSRDLAAAVSGSLASATNLAHHLGTWLTIGVLLAATAAVSLLTLASVTRRTRELGTLKAIGWTSRRIVAQIMTESTVVGLTGATAGLAIGYAGIALVNVIAPRLTATVDDTGGSRSLAVHLNAHTNTATMAGAALLAIAAALVAGTLAAWRTTRLPPAQALTDLD